jgi:hypothetical protein
LAAMPVRAIKGMRNGVANLVCADIVLSKALQNTIEREARCLLAWAYSSICRSCPLHLFYALAIHAIVC